MKTLSKIKLTQIIHVDLNEREMNQLRGGNSCGCGCSGATALSDNKGANSAGGYGAICSCGCSGGNNASDNQNANKM